MDNNLVPRVGTFFVIVAIGLMLLFIASDLGGTPKFDYFFGSLAVSFLGYLLRRNKARPSENVRFKAVRKIRERRKQLLEERKQKQQQDK